MPTIRIKDFSCIRSAEVEIQPITVLKGRGIEHAADQVFATANLWINTEKRCSQFAALIVAKQYPKASSSFQVKQHRFSRKFSAPLHVIEENAEYIYENVFAFRNPLSKK